jgi:hypothetical protein
MIPSSARLNQYIFLLRIINLLVEIQEKTIGLNGRIILKWRIPLQTI